MGTFTTSFEVGATADGPFGELEALVDSGATYTLLVGLLEEGTS